MTTWLKQSTAADVELGPFVSDSDFKTAQTSLSLAQADCQLIKNGGTAAQKNDSTSATHLGGGHYKIPLNTTDTATLGRLRVYVNKSGALPVWRDFLIVPANVYDSLAGTGDKLEVDVAQWAGSNVATPDTTGYPKVTVKSGTGTGEVSLSSGLVSLTTTSRAAVVDEVWDEALSGHATTGSAGKKLSDIPAIAAPTAAAIAGQVWDEALAEHTTAGSAGKKLADLSGGSGDPWVTALPGGYAAGQAGYILGTYLDARVSDMTGGGMPGAGVIAFVYTLTSTVDAAPIADADVWVTADSLGEMILASGRTNGSGQVRFYLDAGTVYLWRRKAGWNFSNPDVEEVTSDE